MNKKHALINFNRLPRLLGLGFLLLPLVLVFSFLAVSPASEKAGQKVPLAHADSMTYLGFLNAGNWSGTSSTLNSTTQGSCPTASGGREYSTLIGTFTGSTGTTDIVVVEGTGAWYKSGTTIAPQASGSATWTSLASGAKTAPNNQVVIGNLTNGVQYTICIESDKDNTSDFNTRASVVYVAPPTNTPTATPTALPATATPNAAVAAPISGWVFRDFNADGVKATLEPGVSGITVNAYDSANALVGSTTTASDGSYSVSSGSILSGVKYRLEFTNLPNYLVPGPMSNGTSGIYSRSSVAFANGGDTNVSFGVQNPAQYAPSDASGINLITSLYINGNGTQANEKTIVRWGYTQGSNGTSMASYPVIGTTELAQPAEVGSTYGLAYQRSSDSLFASAYIKRHIGLMNNAETAAAAGAIYRVPTANGAPGNPVLFATISNIGTAVSGRGLTAGTTTASADSPAFDAVGKTGLGDLEISDDELFLFVVNMEDKEVVQVALGSATSPTAGAQTAFAIPNPCTSGASRPFGTGFDDNKLYVGITCDVLGAGNDAFVYTWSYTPGTGLSGSGTQVLAFDLQYNRGCAKVDGGVCVGAEWNSWISTWPGYTTSDANGNPDNNISVTKNGYFPAYPQPMISDIEFDNGNMILGLRDRWADQTGFSQLNPTGDNHPTTGVLSKREGIYKGGQPMLFTGISAGDILRACVSGGVFTLESGGSCGGKTGTAGNGQGPGNGEYYGGDYFTAGGWLYSHEEVSLGGLVQVAGQSNMVSTAYDSVPVNDLDALHDMGVIHLSNNPGERRLSNRLINGAPMPGSNLAIPTTQAGGKAGGLGDLEYLYAAAPIEIGNRVWSDVDNDGVQDPNEAGISLVVVKLYAGTACSGTLVGTATTNSSGNYVFSSASGTDGNGFDYGLTLTLGSNYTVCVLASDNNGAGKVFQNAGAANAAYSLSTVDVTAGNGNDRNDSDGYSTTGTAPLPSGGVGTTTAVGATVVAGRAETMTTGAIAGGNNHSVDFGFKPNFVNLGNLVFYEDTSGGEDCWADIANTEGGGTGDSQVPSAILYLFKDTNGDNVYSVGDTYVGSTTTGATQDPDSSNYGWGNLIPSDGTAGNTDDYIVVVAAANFYDAASNVGTIPGGITDGSGTDGRLRSHVSVQTGSGNCESGSGGVSDADTITTDNRLDKGDTINNATVGYVVAAQAVDVSLGTEPDTANDTDNTNGEMRIDFGFKNGTLPRVGIGNFVFLDNNNNGIFDAGDAGRNNVNMFLYEDSDNNGSYTAGVDLKMGQYGTWANGANGGFYEFTGMVPGNYLVCVDPAEFKAGGDLVGYTSSTGGTGGSYEPGPDADTVATDSDDNGTTTQQTADGSNPTVCSSVVTVTTGAEPTGETPATGTGIADNSVNFTVDFGFTAPKVCVGNRIFNDINNNGVMDAGETGISGVQVMIYTNNGATTGAFDATDSQVTTGTQASLLATNSSGTLVSASTASTDSNGYYKFCGLTPSTGSSATDYIVVVNTDTSVSTGLASKFNSTGGTLQDPDLPGGDGVDSNDDGDQTNAAVSNRLPSYPITLINATEPTGETDVQGGGSDANDSDSNLTVDFGFYPALSIGNHLFFDTSDNGLKDGAESGVTGAGCADDGAITNIGTVDGSRVVVRIYLDNGDGSFNTASDTGYVREMMVDASGDYVFTGLPAGSYFVVVPACNFASGKALYQYRDSLGFGSPLDSTDGEDSVIDVVGGLTNAASNGVVSQLVVLSAGTQPIGETNTYGALGLNASPDTSTSTNMTVDFGFYQPLTCLGDQLWWDWDNDGKFDFTDTNNNGVLDPGTDTNPESPLAGVVLKIYASDGTTLVSSATGTDGSATIYGNGVYGGGSPVFVAGGISTTDANGQYRFCNLPGVSTDYVIKADASNFTGGGKLVGMQSAVGQDTTTTPASYYYDNAPDPDLDPTDIFAFNANDDDNGVNPATVGDYATAGVAAKAITVSEGTEPDGIYGGVDGDNNRNTNLTVDMGFVLTDYGDAMDDGETQTSNGSEAKPLRNQLTALGARHIITPNLFLGACVDAETVGYPDTSTPNRNPVGDDGGSTVKVGSSGILSSGCADDEDGYNGIAQNGTPTENQDYRDAADGDFTVNITAYNNTGADACVFAWADWNDIGYGDAAGTNIYKGKVTIPSSGTTTTNLTVSGTAFAPNTFPTTPRNLRLRIVPGACGNFLTDLGPQGLAQNGEIEDHAFTSQSPTAVTFSSIETNTFNHFVPSIAGLTLLVGGISVAYVWLRKRKFQAMR